MNFSAWWADAVARTRPDSAPEWGSWAWIAAAAAAVLIAVPALWLMARPVVTIVHELGHAGIGMLLGRRFSGFVVNANMSGHAVTRGRTRGAALVLSTWAGYPAPAIVGAGLVQASLSGWSPVVLGVGAALLTLSLVFCRSWHTLWVVLVTAGASGAAWWWAPTLFQQGLVLGLGLLLLIGAWRHLGAVIRGGGRGDDPGALAAATRVPAGVWNTTFVLVLAACSAWAAWALWGALAS